MSLETKIIIPEVGFGEVGIYTYDVFVSFPQLNLTQSQLTILKYFFFKPLHISFLVSSVFSNGSNIETNSQEIVV
ncbi:hypothetical protein C9439_06580 [archaeon SCG-AAA382B04]|nr:hypothetical protein C9439_06580 [archaeon SCG-AAA382B04]